MCSTCCLGFWGGKNFCSLHWQDRHQYILYLLSSSVLSALVPSVIAMKDVNVEESPLFTSL